VKLEYFWFLLIFLIFSIEIALNSPIFKVLSGIAVEKLKVIHDFEGIL
jgi:NADH:ubiquinone oxidoreductase subunit 3 (subunit A)